MAISLQKGQRVSLEKSDGSSLKKVCVGVNWGMIEKKKLWWKEKIAVDLDASAAIFNANKACPQAQKTQKPVKQKMEVLIHSNGLLGDKNVLFLMLNIAIKAEITTVKKVSNLEHLSSTCLNLLCSSLYLSLTYSSVLSMFNSQERITFK